jgi:signal transduction histidine kinase/ABC-type uncharacterized transport system substrate-binding protein
LNIIRFLPTKNAGLWLSSVAVLLTVVGSSCAYAVGAEVKHNKRILMISEMGMSTPPVFAVTREITSALQESSHRDADFYFESLDTNLYPDEATQKQIQSWILQKYAHRKPDVIIVGGPSPLKWLSSTKDFFPDVPVVFVASFLDETHPPKLPPRFTGVWLQFDPKTALKTALRLAPHTENVYVVGGSSPLDRFMEDIFHRGFRDFESQYHITYLTGLSMPVLLERLHNLPDKSIVVFTLMFEDAAGRKFIPETQALPLVIAAANAPVFQPGDTGMGTGAVGGYLASFAQQGRVAANDVIRILDGTDPGAIPVVIGASEYVFDWRAIERWNLDKRSVPSGSVILFREPTMWQRYRQQLIAIGLVIGVLSILSLYLAFETQRRKRAEAATAASLRFEQIISDLSAQFIDLPADRIDLGIREALDRLVRVLGIDRITVFKFSSDRATLCRMFMSDAGVAPPPHEIPAKNFKWHVSKLLKKECVVVNRVNELSLDDHSTSLAFQYYGIKSGVAVPLEAEGNVVGCVSFVLTKSERVWTDRLVTQLRMIGQIIANALIRKQTDEERLELSGLLINAQEAERTRLARELHDDFSQRIAAVAIDLEAMSKKDRNMPPEAKQKLDQLGGLVIGIGTDLHSVSHQLHSSTLDSLGLVDALDSLCEEIAAQSDIEVDFVHEQVPEPILPDLALCLFRIAQEGLRNVKKHSGASVVEVRLSGTASGVHLSIADNGRGFSHSKVAKSSGLGLRSMQERMRLAGGALEIHSSEGQGTIVEAWIRVDDSVASNGNEVTKSKQHIGD